MKLQLKVMPTPRSGVRTELARLNEQFSAAKRVLEDARRPEGRLAEAVAELDVAEAMLASLRAEDERIFADWLASGGDTARPEPSMATLDAAQRVIRLRQDGDAARKALPAALEAAHQAAAAVGTVGLAREAAVFKVVVEALEAFCQRRLLPAINDMLSLQAAAEGLEQVLWAHGRRHGGSTAALQAATAVAEIIAKTKAAAGVPHGTETGARFLRRLKADPEAEIE
jgi:hypothetical protein